ncbi:hypothetical protein Rhe02_05340 [Rhizocola hellebori]|uniref:Uncharacterized protein n=1 Tax=Rhizocola hellebori TaxID=1392758 RepID=A0A8J3Q337_9ACTN|nr:hypothetical protein [Rhizocola hellebori]GIH02467.1 hypothetical protein Rhe02_05340 [Rhizocola hellebori]
MEFTECPDPTCIAPAEVLNRFVLPSTQGGEPFVRTVCVHRHWFMLPATSLKPSPAPVPGAISAEDRRRGG